MWITNEHNSLILVTEEYEIDDGLSVTNHISIRKAERQQEITCLEIHRYFWELL